jgi:hypothetical protein
MRSGTPCGPYPAFRLFPEAGTLRSGICGAFTKSPELFGLIGFFAIFVLQKNNP